MGFSNPDNFLNRFFCKAGDVIVLNLFFLFCSIPIFTIGASTTALYYSCMKIIKGEDTMIKKDFFKSFKENFKQSTMIWLVFVAIGIILFFNIQFLRNQISKIAIILQYLSYTILILFILEYLYIFPVIAIFKNTTKHLLKNSFLFTYMHFPSTLAIALIWFIPLSLTLTDVTLFPLYIFCWFFFGFSTLALTCSWIFYRNFKKYL